MERASVVFKDLNEIRTQPAGFVKRLEVFKTALSRFKNASTTEMIKDIDNFNKQLTNMSETHQLVLNKGLTNAAELQLDEYERRKKFSAIFDEKDLEKRISQFVSGYSNIFQAADEGADTGSDVINKILLNKFDKEKKNRKNILDPTIKFVGIACRVVNKENVTVIVLADNCIDKKNLKRPKNENEDLSDLKRAFDWFDVNKVGIIKPSEMMAAMRQLGYDLKNPSMFQICLELDTDEHKDGFDFDTFADHILFRLDDVYTDDGLRRVFNIFIDDPNQDTITLQTLKKVCRELGENYSVDQLKEMLEKASVNSNELTFEEFSEFMKNKFPVEDKPAYLDV